ncbi:MAG: TRAP transporter permease [Alphaproteobacteria bacterium]|nr:TRAP transporter permease [Alphaproteobacteria bacterium]
MSGQARSGPDNLSLLERALRLPGVDVTRTVACTVAALSIALALFHLFCALFGTPESRAFRSTHLVVMLVLAFLLRPLGRASPLDPVLVPGDPGNARRMAGFAADMALAALGIFVQVYTLFDLEAFLMRQGDITDTDIAVGTLMVVLVLEATRRMVGLAMVAVAGFFVAHALFTQHFPGFLYGPPTSYRKFIDFVFMRTEGIFGIPIYVASTYILLFILFGAILLRSGAGRFFIDFAVSLTGHRIGGPAKASVVASSCLGTVSGSAVANVVTTGPFTIPLMKQLGYRPRFAGAVEACASSGGQITPPIMGAAAFLVAEFLHISYLWVIVAAIIPTALYYTTVYFMVHLEAEKHGIGRISRDQLPRFRHVLARGWHLLLALGVLLSLLFAGYTPMLAAFWSIVALVGLSFLRRDTAMTAVDLFAALETGVRNTVPVTIACACAGIIIGSIFTSGLGLKFTYSVIDLAGGSLPILLLLTAVGAIILGMGMTTTAVYITVAALVVPALIEIGVVPIAAHFFALYFGVVSSITPPVALASFAAAAVAGAPPMATAVESARIGIAKYLVPFAFVYNPSLVLEGPIWMTAVSLPFVLAGVWALSLALEGWYRGSLSAALRIVLVLTGGLLFLPPQATIAGVPGWWLVAIGGVILLLVVVGRRRGLLRPARSP